MGRRFQSQYKILCMLTYSQYRIISRVQSFGLSTRFCVCSLIALIVFGVVALILVSVQDFVYAHLQFRYAEPFFWELMMSQYKILCMLTYSAQNANVAQAAEASLSTRFCVCSLIVPNEKCSRSRYKRSQYKILCMLTYRLNFAFYISTFSSLSTRFCVCSLIVPDK